MELTEEQEKFLAECENEFSNRYSESDANFMELKNRPLSKPPIVDPWGNNYNRNHQRGGGGQYRPYNNQRHWRGGQSWNRDSYSRYDDNRHRERSYDDRGPHRDRQYDDRGPHRDRPYDDRSSDRDRHYSDRDRHYDRSSHRDRTHDDRGEHRGDSQNSRYRPY